MSKENDGVTPVLLRQDVNSAVDALLHLVSLAVAGNLLHEHTSRVSGTGLRLESVLAGEAGMTYRSRGY